MTATAFAIGYLCAGVVIALVLRRRGASPRDSSLAIIIWPVSFTTALSLPAPKDARASSLRSAARAVESAWGEGRFGDSRELGAVRAFIAKLSATELQIQQMRGAATAASATVAEKLKSLTAMREQELSEGIRLLEELSGQLILLRFAHGADTVDGDRKRIEEVLARIEALADLSSADAGAVDKVALKC